MLLLCFELLGTALIYQHVFFASFFFWGGGGGGGVILTQVFTFGETECDLCLDQ